MRKRDAYDDVARDGERVRVPFYLMDARQRAVLDLHQPGYRSSNSNATVRDARMMVRDARDEMIRRLNDAWRSPGRDHENVEISEPDDPGDPNERQEPSESESDRDKMSRHLSRERAYEERKRQLEAAYLTPGRPVSAAPMVIGAGPAEAIQRQGEAWRHGR